MPVRHGAGGVPIGVSTGVGAGVGVSTTGVGVGGTGVAGTGVGVGVAGLVGRGVGAGVGPIAGGRGVAIGLGVEIGGGPPPIGGLSWGIGCAESLGAELADADSLAPALAVELTTGDGGPAAFPSTPSPCGDCWAPVSWPCRRSSRPPVATKPAAVMSDMAARPAAARTTRTARGVNRRAPGAHGAEGVECGHRPQTVRAGGGVEGDVARKRVARAGDEPGAEGVVQLRHPMARWAIS